MVINAYEWAAEGEYFAKGDEYAVVNLRQWGSNKPRHQHYAPESA